MKLENCKYGVGMFVYYYIYNILYKYIPLCNVNVSGLRSLAVERQGTGTSEYSAAQRSSRCDFMHINIFPINNNVDASSDYYYVSTIPFIIIVMRRLLRPLASFALQQCLDLSRYNSS